MPTLKPLRYTLSGLCLLAGMASAQAALTIHFEEDVASGHLTITFSGQQAVPFTMNSTWGDFAQFSGGSIFVLNTTARWTNTSGWTREALLPWTGGYANPVSFSGVGGFNSPSATGLQAMSMVANDFMIWDGQATYVGDLDGIGLADGQSGVITFTNGTDSININWSATVIPVPEPATYAAVLGLGVAGVALLRRRRAARR